MKTIKRKTQLTLIIPFNFLLLTFYFLLLTFNCQAQTTVCQGDTVILIVDNPAGSIQWQQSADQVVWQNIAGEINDTLKTAVADLYYRALMHDTVCTHQYSYYSDTLYFNQIGYLATSLTITSSATGAIYSGQSVSFTATPINGGISPAYQWKKNGNIILGEVLSTYTTNLLASGDTINCVLFSSYPCVTGNPAVSNKIATNVFPSCGNVTDIDGNIYHTVQIGTQCWMVENIKTRRYRDGTFIPFVPDSLAWNALTSSGCCSYDNNLLNDSIYGLLYNWWAIIDSRNICPAGWHVATDGDFTILTNYLGGESVAGGRMKEVGNIHWQTPNSGANNEVGFTALPAGFRNSSSDFGNLFQYGVWWCSTDYSTWHAWARYTTYNTINLVRDYQGKKNGYSVRLVKD